MTTRKRILICDDSLTIRKLLEMVLVPAGFEVLLANSGQEAIATAKRENLDLLLLDFILPDMKGRDVCDALAANPKTATLPVLVVSGKGDELSQVFRNTRAVVGFVHKPFQGDQVLEQVRRALPARPATTDPAPAAAAAAPAAAKPAAPPPPPARPEFERKEALARALFGVLREQFARIPDLMPQLGEQSPGMFFAKKFLTPAVIDAMVAAIQPATAPTAPGSAIAELANLAQDATLLLADAAPVRSAGFSARLAQTELPANARAVLALVDGRHTVAQIVERSNLPPIDVVRVLATHARSGLIQLQRPSAKPVETAPCVAVVTTDLDGIQQPLAQHLAQRARPLDTIALSSGTVAELVEQLVARRPTLVVLDMQAAPADLDALQRELRARRELRDVRCVTIAGDKTPVPVGVSGPGAMLQRPIRLADLDALLH